MFSWAKGLNPLTAASLFLRNIEIKKKFCSGNAKDAAICKVLFGFREIRTSLRIEFPEKKNGSEYLPVFTEGRTNFRISALSLPLKKICVLCVKNKVDVSLFRECVREQTRSRHDAVLFRPRPSDTGNREIRFFGIDAARERIFHSSHSLLGS